MNRAVFMDRDGVLLDNTAYRNGCGSIIPGTRAALRRLKDEGYMLIVATNQPDIASGKVSIDAIERIHMNLSSVLPIDVITYCPHDDSARCKCRKPKPGMLREFSDVNFAGSYMIGDRWSDISAGEAAGCKTILIGTGYGEPFPVKPDIRAADLAHAVDLILGVE